VAVIAVAVVVVVVAKLRLCVCVCVCVCGGGGLRDSWSMVSAKPSCFSPFQVCALFDSRRAHPRTHHPHPHMHTHTHTHTHAPSRALQRPPPQASGDGGGPTSYLTTDVAPSLATLPSFALYKGAHAFAAAELAVFYSEIVAVLERGAWLHTRAGFGWAGWGRGWLAWVCGFRGRPCGDSRRAAEVAGGCGGGARVCVCVWGGGGRGGCGGGGGLALRELKAACRARVDAGFRGSEAPAHPLTTAPPPSPGVACAPPLPCRRPPSPPCRQSSMA
jgi:hypothetical protein